MARPKSTVARKRVNLDLPVSVAERLKELQELAGFDSVTAVVRRSLALFDLALTKQHEGSKLLLEDPAGDQREVLLLEENYGATR